jgi:hypothetical protein
MNKREQLLAQLAELEQDEPEQTQETGSQQSGGLWDTQKHDPNWKAPVWYVEGRVVQNTSENFKIGDIYDGGYGRAHLLIQAIPKPTYADCGAKVGDELTNSLMLEHSRLEFEWYHAATDLESCIRWTRQKLIAQGLDIDGGCAWLNRSVQTWEEADERRYLEKTWAFLVGLWTGKRMNPPSEQQLETWAREGWRPRA